MFARNSTAFQSFLARHIGFRCAVKKQLFIFFVILLLGCSLDSPDMDELPVWSITVEIPIIQTSIDLDTFLEDSLI